MELIAATSTLLLQSIQEIDNEISQLEARIISLKSTRNTLAPISRLHPEITQEIFNITTRSSREKGKTALLLTWISHYWRDLAHQTPNIWSIIDFHNQEWVSMALSRAGDQALEFRFGEASPASLFNLCLVNMARIGTLEIHSRPDLTLEKWTTPAPRLVGLDLRGMSLPPNLFSNTCPSLRTLSLISCNFDWDAFPRPLNLVELVISSPESQTTLDRIINILQATARGVERLEIEYVLEESSPEERNHSPISKRVRFNRIQTLGIKEYDSATLKDLLDNMSLLNLPDTFALIFSAESEELDWPVVSRALMSARGLDRWEIDRLNCFDLTLVERDKSMLSIRRHIPVASDSASESNLTFSPPVQTQGIETVFVSITDRHSHVLDYFSASTIVQNLVFNDSSVPTFTALLESQLNRLSAPTPTPTATHSRNIGRITMNPPPEVLSDADKANVRNILVFRHLKSLELPARLYDLAQEHAHTWLLWRKAIGLPPLEKFVMGSQSRSSEELSKMFVGLVDKFEFVDIPELPSWFGAWHRRR